MAMDTVSEFLSNLTHDIRHDCDDLNLPEDLVIGEQMHDFMSELQTLGFSLLKTLDTLSIDENAQKLLEKYVREIKRQSCKVAVIGQMKAGKSSFINALIGHENLLPSDVNPWTTVVTRLHFGISGMPEEGAEFSFFDENLWLQIAQGDTKLRSLVERFLPGFESARLTEQLEEMRTQAERRLGPQFHDLLGHSHWFDRITPDVIKRYVCAGSVWNAQSDQSAVGRFSDITETADIYFGRPPFAFPTTITDTPGTNDPFFVRDEITFRNLQNADIFIVVLTAQQAFSISDLALLRILQGLQKDRIIIFINRIDQLDDWKHDSQEIVEHVKYMLHREFPTINFPVIAGSALWGKMALPDKKNNHLAPDQNDLDADVKSPSTIKIDTGEVLTRDQARSELYLCSGIPEIAATLSKLMLLKSKNRGSVNKIASTLKLTSDSLLAVMSNKFHAIKSEMKRLDTHGDVPRLNAPELTQEQIRYQDLISKCTALQHSHYHELQQIQKFLIDSFRKKMSDIVVAFAQKECESLVATMQKRKNGKVWRCDTTKIRQSFEDEFLVVCQSAANHINTLQGRIIKQLRLVLQMVSVHVNDDFLNYKDISEGQPYLSTLALKHKLALDLDQSWWKMWAQKHSLDHWAQELDKLIKAEFFPMVERLVQSATSELKQRMDDANANLITMVQSIINIIEDKLSKLRHESEEQSNALAQYQTPSVNTGVRSQRRLELEQELTVVQNKVVTIERISKKLKDIMNQHNSQIENVRQSLAQIHSQ
ncbi:MAG: dynamin family protein [Pseudomonadota bacterium]